MDVADRAVMQALDGLKVAGLVMALEADADLEVLPLRLFGGGEELADARRVGGDGLLAKTCLPCFTASSKWIGR